MTNQLHYRDYIGSVFFSEEDEVFHGKVIGISDSISFEGNSVSTLTQDFRSAVDEYISFCSNVNKNPEKSTFSVKISPVVYNDAIVYATQRGISLNTFVEEAIKTNLHV